MINVLAEGKGDREAGPALIRNILLNHLNEYYILVQSKARSTAGKGDLIKDFENLLRFLFRRADCEGILVLVDSDNDCAEDLAKQLASRAKAISPVSVAVVCAVEEFENWFL